MTGHCNLGHGGWCPARAKINLTLHVVNRRPDGYHELDSLIAFADYGDELAFAAAQDLSLAVEGPFAACLETTVADNLALRAARALRAHAGVRAGARVVLRKNLPVAAGLGGGSADAAAVLLGLDALWGVGASREELASIGLSLGADVPVCLAGRPSIVGGIGERILPAPSLPGAWVVLVNPGVAVSTAAVFAVRQGSFGPPAPAPPARGWDGPSALAQWLAEGRNDLEDAARELAPEIGSVLSALAACENCLIARMSGSGATCFGLFATRSHAERAARNLRDAGDAWWVRPAALGT